MQSGHRLPTFVVRPLLTALFWCCPIVSAYALIAALTAWTSRINSARLRSSSCNMSIDSPNQNSSTLKTKLLGWYFEGKLFVLDDNLENPTTIVTYIPERRDLIWAAVTGVGRKMTAEGCSLSRGAGIQGSMRDYCAVRMFFSFM